VTYVDPCPYCCELKKEREKVMKQSTVRSWLTFGLLLITCLGTAHAAYISIDDSHPGEITVTAGDFEGGFFVNGSLLTSGLGDSGSVTLPDEGYFIEGSWIDDGAADGTSVAIFFALPGDPSFATSGIEFSVTSDGRLATLTGSFGGFIDPSLYFPSPTPTFLQDGHSEAGGVAFLTASFTSEAATQVPEPGTLLLLGAIGPGLLLRRRR